MHALMSRRHLVVATMLVVMAIVLTESVVLAATVRQGTTQYMKVATDQSLVHTETTTWSDVPGTALALSVPQGEHHFFQVTFSINGPGCRKVASGDPTAFCSVRAAIDGQPASPGEIHIGHSDYPQQDLTATFQWVSTVLGPGTHYVKMQYRVTGPSNTNELSTRTMTVIQARAY